MWGENVFQFQNGLIMSLIVCEHGPCNGDGGTDGHFSWPSSGSDYIHCSIQCFCLEEDDFSHEKNLERKHDIVPQGIQRNLVRCDLFVGFRESHIYHGKRQPSNNFPYMS